MRWISPATSTITPFWLNTVKLKAASARPRRRASLSRKSAWMRSRSVTSRTATTHRALAESSLLGLELGDEARAIFAPCAHDVGAFEALGHAPSHVVEIFRRDAARHRLVSEQLVRRVAEDVGEL